MKIIEKYLPEGSRLLIFKFVYAILLLIICSFLIFRQIFEAEKYEAKERIQGQRRIIRPGPRGDVFDREGNLLIGNRANFSAVIQLAELKQESLNCNSEDPREWMEEFVRIHRDWVRAGKVPRFPDEGAIENTRKTNGLIAYGHSLAEAYSRF